MTKFYDEMQTVGLKFDEVSKINKTYLTLLNKSSELNVDFSKIIAEDGVIAIAKKVKSGEEITTAFKKALDNSTASKEVKVTLKELL